MVEMSDDGVGWSGGKNRCERMPDLSEVGMNKRAFRRDVIGSSWFLMTTVWRSHSKTHTGKDIIAVLSLPCEEAVATPDWLKTSQAQTCRSEGDLKIRVTCPFGSGYLSSSPA